MDISFGETHLQQMGRFNFLLGKNGAGKSHLLKAVESACRANKEQYGQVQYISPERAGVLQWEPSIDQNLANSPNWIHDSRRNNQTPNFRQQSATRFRRLELTVLRQIERDPAIRSTDFSFDLTIQVINTLLDRVEIVRDDGRGFRIEDRESHAVLDPSTISSGEAELISLGIECLAFVHETDKSKINVLLFDEPDVHLHPDLQARLGRFLAKLVAENSHIAMLLATHSTAFLGALPASDETRVGFMRYRQTEISFTPIGKLLKRILPVFGAHPLSNVFNEAPAMLVEGDDDERVWQQAVRSADGAINLYPVPVDSIDHLATYEKEVSLIIDAVYDNATAYSLRDRDEHVDAIELTDLRNVVRARLACRSAENLLLCDDVLTRLQASWEELMHAVETWLATNMAHPHFHAIREFRDGGFDRKGADLKEIRNDLVGMLGSNKAWEITVGQAIAALVKGSDSGTENSLRNYLGEKVCTRFLKLVPLE